MSPEEALLLEHIDAGTRHCRESLHMLDARRDVMSPAALAAAREELRAEAEVLRSRLTRLAVALALAGARASRTRLP
jgi:hypothetical protein